MAEGPVSTAKLRKPAADERRALESAFRQIVESIPVPVAVTTPTGDVESLNQATLDYFGRTFEELKGWKSSDVVHPDDLDRTVAAQLEAHLAGCSYNVESRHRRADGVYRWFNVLGLPLRDEQGNILRWFHLQIDIDGRKRAEDALKASEIDLTHIINTIPAFAWSAHPDGAADFFNEHYLDYMGLTAEQARDWGWTTAVHPDDRESLAERWRGIMASGQTGETEARLRRVDGAYRWFLFRVSPLHDETGAIVKWYGTNTDIDDLKLGETFIRDSEQRFRTIFDEAGTGITLLDLAVGEPIQNNRALQKMLDCTEQELGLYETFERLTFEGDRESDARTFRELCEGKCDTLRMEKHFVLRDGRSIWANVIFTLLRDDAGNPRYVIAIHEDITERKLTVEKLQAKQDLLDLAQKAARAMAFDWYIQEPVNTWSPEQEALYGLAPGTFDGRFESWKSLVHPRDWPLVIEALQHAHKTGDISIEFRVIWPDGSTHWLAANGQMFFDEESVPYRMVGFTTDVTSRKRAEEELRRSEAFLAEGQHLSRIGNFSWRAASDEIMWSEQLYRIFEFEPDLTVTLELIGSRVHPDDASMLFDMVERARNGVTDFEYEHRLLMPDNSIKHLHLIAHRAPDRDGQVEYIGAVQDVTERRVAEEALSKARSELAHVARASTLGVLTASIAHEVNQPLSGIITNASTCLRMLGSDPPNVDGALETARRTIRDGKRASDVITRLRALFGKKDITTESIDLNEATQEVLALSRSELQRGQVIVQTQLANDLWPVIGDRVQLQQVILNFVLNASDAMSTVDDRSRQMIVKTENSEDASVRFSVRDTGVGLHPDILSQLFDAFFTTKSTGMGIGLSISRSIIEGHQGQIGAMPNDGPGATFYFSVPCSPMENGVVSIADAVSNDDKHAWRKA
jgi:PAS domain S-box-containing protein